MANVGHVKYDPKIHFNHGKPWTNKDENYLITYQKSDSITDLSLALGRTYKTIADRIYELRKAGRIPKK